MSCSPLAHAAAPLQPPAPGPMPDLASYDVILVNSSAGKDSQAMLSHLYGLCRRAGVVDRMVVVHVDLGQVEWEGTRDLAEEQAKAYGLRFVVVRRDRDLLHQIEHERKKFPDSSRRYCTSDQKTKPVVKLMTQLVRDLGLSRQARILNCLGLRADESAARAKRPPLSVDVASNGRRHVDRWLPIHTWTVEHVWARIKASGLPVHPAYAMGMPRLSCSFCVLSSKSALVRAAQLRPALAETYRGIEERIGHTFRKDLPMSEIIRLAKEASQPVAVEGWNA